MKGLGEFSQLTLEGSRRGEAWEEEWLGREEEPIN